MKATKPNIGNVLRTNMTGIKMTTAPAKNGYCLTGFLKRSALQDLMNNFHCYINKKQQLVVLTPGMESTEDRL